MNFLFNSHKCVDIPKKKSNWFDYDDKLIACSKEACCTCVEALIKAGAEVNNKDDSNSTALIEAAKSGNPKCVRLLLEAGADLRATDNDEGKPALAHAVSEWSTHHSLGDLTEEQTECVEILLEATGVDVSPWPKGTEATLISVAYYGDLARLQALIEAGADVNACDKDGRTALVNASANGHKGCVTVLLKSGADVNVVCNDVWTPLKEAIASNRYDCIPLLIEAGADTKDSKDISFLVMIALNGASTAHTTEQQGKMFRTIQQVMKLGGYVNIKINMNAHWRGKNTLQELLDNQFTQRWQVPMLLVAAGEKVDDDTKENIRQRNWSYSLSCEDEDEQSLKCLSREAVRKYMIQANPNDNLFCAVEKLEIPEALKSFLVYDVSLDQEYNPEVDETDDESDSWEDVMNMLLLRQQVAAAANGNPANGNAVDVVNENPMNAANGEAGNVAWVDFAAMMNQHAAAANVNGDYEAGDEAVDDEMREAFRNLLLNAILAEDEDEEDEYSDYSDDESADSKDDDEDDSNSKRADSSNQDGNDSSNLDSTESSKHDNANSSNHENADPSEQEGAK